MQKIDCIAFGAHPDDVELFCSGLIIKLNKQGFSTAIVDLTQGELSTNGTLQSRKLESQKAAAILKVKNRYNLKIPDGNIEKNQNNLSKIISMLRKYQPRVVLVPYWEDRHPDHVAASNLITEACFYSGLAKIKTDQEAYRPNLILYYMQHSNFNPTFVVDISEEMDTKIEAIRAYETQFNATKEKSNETYINRPEFFDSIINRAKFYGYEIKVKFGEPYFLKDMLKINNIMEIIS